LSDSLGVCEVHIYSRKWLTLIGRFTIRIK